MVGHRCDALNRFLGKHLDRALNGGDKCFDVSTELTRGAWVLLPAAFVSGVVGVVLLRRAKAKLDEPSARAERRTKDDFCFLWTTCFSSALWKGLAEAAISCFRVGACERAEEAARAQFRAARRRGLRRRRSASSDSGSDSARPNQLAGGGGGSSARVSSASSGSAEHGSSRRGSLEDSPR